MQLPDKPSELLTLALEDLEWIERNPKIDDYTSYEINMTRWHSLEKRGNKSVCAVCLAGAVMAHSLRVPWFNDPSPSALGENICDKLNLLDWLRVGGADILGGLYSADEQWVLGEMSKRDREEWKLHMQDLIGYLEAHDL